MAAADELERGHAELAARVRLLEWQALGAEPAREQLAADAFALGFLAALLMLYVAARVSQRLGGALAELDEGMIPG